MIKGLSYPDTWGGRKTEGALISNPIDQLEWIFRNQNLNNNSGFSIVDHINTTSLDSSNLDELRTIVSCRQLLNDNEMTTDYLIKSLCKEFFLVHYQNGSGQECIDYIFKPRTPEFDIVYTDHFDKSQITPPNKKNIYVEPIINYGYDYALEKYTKSACVKGIIDNTTWDNTLTPGFTDAHGLLVWNKCRQLYLRYGIYEPMPDDLQNKKWIVNYADAYWWINRFYGIEMTGFMDWSRISIDLGYYDAIYTKQLQVGKIGTLNLPHETGGSNFTVMVESIYPKRNEKIVTVDLIILDDMYEYSTDFGYQDNDDSGERIQSNDDTGEIIQEN